MLRRGDDYVAGLRDGRTILLDGERVADVTTHPAFAAPVRRIAEQYDRAREAAARPVTETVDPETGDTIGAMWLRPRSAATWACAAPSTATGRRRRTA